MRTLLIATMAVAALPLWADDPKTQTTDTAQPPAATTTATPALTTTSAPTANDSPLVRAAKSKNAANAPKKKSIVITNDTLKKDGGHITTTTNQNPLPTIDTTPTAADQERTAKMRRDAEAKGAAARAAKEKAQKQAKAEKAAAEAVGDTPESLYDDPAAVEHRADQATQQTTTQEQKPPR